MKKFSISNTDNGQLIIQGELNQYTLSKDGWQYLSDKQKSSLSASKNITVSLADIFNVDTAGLAWLLNFKRDAIIHSVSIKFSSLPQKVVDLAKLSNADALITH